MTFNGSAGSWHFKVEVMQREVDWERMQLTLDPAQVKSIEFEGDPSSELEAVIVSAITSILDSGKIVIGPNTDLKG